MKKIKKKKRRYVSDYIDDIDFCNAGCVCDCTGLMPSLPRSEEEIESYKNVYDFLPAYVSDRS